MEDSWESMAEAARQIGQTAENSDLTEWVLGEFKRCREHLQQCLRLVNEETARRSRSSSAHAGPVRPRKHPRCAPRAARRRCSPTKQREV